MDVNFLKINIAFFARHGTHTQTKKEESSLWRAAWNWKKPFHLRDDWPPVVISAIQLCFPFFFPIITELFILFL